MKKWILLVALGVLCITANAQTIIKPGDKLIHANWLKPGHDFYRCRVKDTTGKLLYDFMMEDFTTIDSVKKQITFARYRQVSKGDFSTDTSVTDLQFRPIRMYEIHYQRGISYDMRFDADKATVKTNKKGAVSEKVSPMEPGYFEDNMIENIFGYLELKKGVIYKLDNFNRTPVPSDPYIISVAFEDSNYTTPDHSTDYTVLNFTHGGTKGYIWIDKSTHLLSKIIGNSVNSTYIVTKL